jgi:hypothetical protein
MQFIQLRNSMEKWQQSVAQGQVGAAVGIRNPPFNEVTPINLEAHAFRTSMDEPPITNAIRTPLDVAPLQRKVPELPIVPVIPTNIHKTVTENIEYWITNSYYKYLERDGMSLSKLGWSRTLQQRYCKRRDIAQWVKIVGENVLGMTLDWKGDSDVLLHIATILDEERGSKTVIVALEEFKQEHELSWKKGRKRKEE